MYLEQIKLLANWDYCKSDQVAEDEVVYQFGWRDGLHFYLSDYFLPDEMGQFFLICYLNKEQIVAKSYFTFNEVLLRINEILK